MGGSWERQIRTVRSVLTSLLEETGRQLDDETFRTLLKEVQAIVNSRPMALNDMSSPDLPDPLTPNHLLTMKSKVLMPPAGVFFERRHLPPQNMEKGPASGECILGKVEEGVSSHTSTP